MTNPPAFRIASTALCWARTLLVTDASQTARGTIRISSILRLMVQWWRRGSVGGLDIMETPWCSL